MCVRVLVSKLDFALHSFVVSFVSLTFQCPISNCSLIIGEHVLKVKFYLPLPVVSVLVI